MARVQRELGTAEKPRPAVETLTHYFRYCANLARIKGTRTQVGCIIKAAHLVAPALPGSLNYDLNALAMLMRDWASDSLLTGHDLATFLITENLNDLHSLLANNPLVGTSQNSAAFTRRFAKCFSTLAPSFPVALREYSNALEAPAAQLAGATLGSVENLLKTTEHKRETLC
jgi:hypothetical protein